MCSSVAAFYVALCGSVCLSAHALTRTGQRPHTFVTGFGHKFPTPPPAAPPPPHVDADPSSIAYTVTPNEAGYLTVARLESTPDMEVFAKRVLSTLNLEVTDEARFLGTVPFYSGERTMQSFFAMKQEFLGVAAGESSWLGEKSLPGSFFMEQHITGSTAPLSERGYKAIVSTANHGAMVQFMTRTAKDLGYHVIDQRRLDTLAKFHSGEFSSRSFARLRAEIIGTVRLPEAWATCADEAYLGEVGFDQTLRMNSEDEMLKFTRRVAHHVGCKLDDDIEYGLKKVAEFSRRGGTQTYDWLETMVRKVCKVSDEIHYGSMHDIVGRDGVLQLRLGNSTRYKSSAKRLQHAGVAATLFAATDAKTASEEQLKQACPLKTDPDAQAMCGAQEDKLGIWGLAYNDPGCASKVEQAITDSHRRALIEAQEREQEWTAIIEDDVVPLHPGLFDEAFKNMWEKVPSWAKLVRLGWCTFEQDVGSIRKKTYSDAFPFRLVQEMTWYDSAKRMDHYYTGGCTTGYMVHKSLLPELIGIFPCCCPIDCCLERQLFYAPTKPVAVEGKYRGEQILINMDAWDSNVDSYNYTNFFQGGVFVQDNRHTASERPGWNAVDSDK